MNNLETYLDYIIADKSVENIAVRIGRGSEIVYEAYRSVSGRIDKNTLFDMASVTKIVVTTPLCLIAIDKGLLSPSDKVSKFFSCPGDKKELTVYHLLTHTMGIGHKSLCSGENTYENIGQYILDIPSDIEIGSDVLYSCPGFILLGKILEKVFGDRLDRLFEKYVAEPLKMTSSSFLPNRSKDIVNSNRSLPDKGVVNDYNCRHLGGVAGNAGLFSNVSDMTKYVQMILNFGAPLFDFKIFDMATKNYTKKMAESRGLGFLYVDERYKQTGGLFRDGSIGHCGHTGQSVFADPDSGLYVIILSDATISSEKKHGTEVYDEVIKIRENIHNAIKADLKL